MHRNSRLSWRTSLLRCRRLKAATSFGCGPQPFFIRLVQKAMAPAQCGIAVHANLRGRCPYRSGLAQHDDVIEPLLAQPEPRQRRAGQVVECTQALAAAKALAVIGLAMPVQLPASAMRAAALRRPAVCNKRREPVKAPLRLPERHRPHGTRMLEQCAMRN